MKAMLLAAGKGKRMLPLTRDCPKPLLKAGGKALIVYHLEKLAEAGITEVVINHAWLGPQLEAYLGNGEAYGLSITYSPEGEPLETAGGIHRALPLLGTGPFAVISSDIWTDYSFTRLPEVELGDDQAHLVMVANAPHHPQGDFRLEGGRLALAGTEEGETCTYSGIGIFRPELFAGREPGFLPLRPILDEAIARGEVSAELYAGKWFDIGSPQRLEQLDRSLRARS